MGKNNTIPPFPFSTFLEDIKNQMKLVFRNLVVNDPMGLQRGIPPAVLSEIMSHNPLSACIPEEYGGRGGHVDEILALLSAASYESLAFSLTLGINSGLFLQPVAKYAREEVKKQIFSAFLNERKMGGLMITEPDYGTDALNMQTFFTKNEGKYHIRGTKHWAGLTGFADYWILTARERLSGGDLNREIGFFICDVNAPGQEIFVEEYFDNLGLHQIPYGRNRIDVVVPDAFRLEPKTSGIKLLLDLLHRSRLHFPGMAMGFIHRMMDEAFEHCKQRRVSGKYLVQYDQVQQRLARLQASYTLTSAMCAYSSRKAGIEHDLSSYGLVANSVKSLCTDLMHEAAQSLVQLVGGKAYRYNSIGGRGIIDSRPFQIFEGSNDILYAQITEGILKRMKTAGEHNLFRYLKNYRRTGKAALFLKDVLDFELNMQLPQRKSVDLGQVISRIISMEMVIDLGTKKFRKDLIDNCLGVLIQDIQGLMGNFRLPDNSLFIEDYQEGSSWMNLQ